MATLPSPAPLETESPELSVFDVAAVRLQTYRTAGGDSLVVLRVERDSGQALFSASFFGAPSGSAIAPRIEVSEFDECAPEPNAELIALADDGGAIKRYLIVGASEAAVRAKAQAFRDGWGFAYDPRVSSPRRRSDGRWVADAFRSVSAD